MNKHLNEQEQLDSKLLYVRPSIQVYSMEIERSLLTGSPLEGLGDLDGGLTESTDEDW